MRKEISLDEDTSSLYYKLSRNEIEVSKIVKNNIFKNVVRIYDISYPTKKIGYIDQEWLLTTDFFVNNQIPFPSSKKTLIKDIRQGLRELHSHCILYIDLKADNVGWSETDRKWKLFDFNLSGMLQVEKINCTKNKWYITEDGIEISPVQGFRYEEAIKMLKSDNLKKIDSIIFKEFVKEINELFRSNKFSTSSSSFSTSLSSQSSRTKTLKLKKKSVKKTKSNDCKIC